MESGSSICTYDKLESIILDGSSGPCSLSLEYLRRITDNFSDDRLLGEGGFGKVYKGVLENGQMVAIKRLDQLLKPGVLERQFENEVFHLMRLKHPNIVRFLGYCYEIRNECVEHDGKYIFAEMQQKLICLEYLPNGSLERHVSDESSGHEWHTRYKIIKGICCGLLYLHEECHCQFGASIIHLDLKPGNILLDEYMVPKIADFGLSRLFEDNKTKTCATSVLGSLGYMAPEYLIRRIVTAKADIYNLGVIITEIITGTKVDIFSFSSPTSRQMFVDSVINNWRNRLGGAPSETACKQIKHCLEIGLGCIKFNREERPTSREIFETLVTWETTHCNSNTEKRPAADQQIDASAAGPRRRRDGSLNRSRPRGFFHQQLSCVMRFLLSCLHSSDEDYFGEDDNYLSEDDSVVSCSADHELQVPCSAEHFIDEDYFVEVDDLGEVDSYLCLDGGIVSCSPDHELQVPCSAEASGMEFSSMDPTEKFTFAQIEAAAMGFSLEAKIGEGSFGTVYRGYLPDGREVAIKRAKSGSGPRSGWFQGREFLSEVAFLSRLRYKHLVDLLGYCAENKELLLVYEYMRNGALYDHLHPKPKAEASESSSPSLAMSSWKLRIRILLDSCRGIECLHSYALLPVIHCDIKSSNILLDASWRACLSGFGLSLTECQAWGRLTAMVPGTVGYLDPEYYRQHRLTVKSDVYSFGVVMLEVLTGKPAIFEESAEAASPMSVVDYAVPSIVSGELGKVLDPRVPEPDAHETEALGLVAFIALHCVRLQGKDRPAMSAIAANLETAFALCEGSFDGDVVKSPSRESATASLSSS